MAIKSFIIGLLLTASIAPTAYTEENSDIYFRDFLETLSSDEFGGRAPASKFEPITVSYLEKQFKSFGLQPGNKNSYRQNVPLRAYQTEPNAVARISAEGKSLDLQYGTEFVSNTQQVVSELAIDESPIVFVGYGIVAPEYGWNDYEGIDVRGKTVVILVNDPGLQHPDKALFKGVEMTYYGRHDYKFEEASRQGAKAALIVHETRAASYPWQVVQNSMSGPQRAIVNKDTPKRVELEGWIPQKTAIQLFEFAGLNYHQAKVAAARKGFKAYGLPLKFQAKLENTYSYENSDNVIAYIKGSERPDEYVTFIAHWDHLGVGRPNASGDAIYNGAADNATGTAGLLELARSISQSGITPKRSIIFLAVTAEEYGLFGSRYYVENPIFPLERTIAVINMDVMNYFGSTTDVSVVGYGKSELDQYVDIVGEQLGRTITKNSGAKTGFYYRSDHFSFAKAGVPSLIVRPGFEHKEKGRKWLEQQVALYYTTRYHTPEDEYHPGWNLNGTMEDLLFIEKLGLALANDDQYPNWYPDDEFRSVRDSYLNKFD